MQIVTFERQDLGTRETCLHGKGVRYDVGFERAQLTGGAQVTAISYVACKGDARRPVVFVTNGGPGSSCAWMHLGLFGPRRVSVPDALRPPTCAPFELEDNPHCLLDI